MKGVFCDETELIELRQAMRPLQLPYSCKMAVTGSGGVHSKVRGRGVDFLEVRKYELGDDSRNIDWRVTARRGRVHTKVFTEERERPVYFVVDQTKSMLFGTRNAFKSVMAARVCAQVAWGAQAFGDRIGAIVFSDSQHSEQIAKPGQRAVLALIRLLTKHNKDLFEQRESQDRSDGGLTHALERLCRASPKGSIVIVVSDFTDNFTNIRPFLSMLGRHNDVLGFYVYDKIESLLPEGHYSFSNRKETLSLDISEKTRLAFQAAFSTKKEQLGDLFRQVGGQVFELTTDANLTQWMIETFGAYTAFGRRAR